MVPSRRRVTAGSGIFYDLRRASRRSRIGYCLIQADDRRYPIRFSCHLLPLSPAGCHLWRRRRVRQVANQALRVEMRQIPQDFRETCGSPRIRHMLLSRLSTKRGEGQTMDQERRIPKQLEDQTA